MNQIYVEEANGSPAEAETVTISFRDDAEELVTTFGEASVLTVQENG